MRRVSRKSGDYGESQMADSFPLQAVHDGVRFTLGSEEETMRLLFTMVRDGVATVEQAMKCIEFKRPALETCPDADAIARGIEWYRQHGHGHVTLRDDGSKARCGGPVLCNVCALEETALNREVSR